MKKKLSILTLIFVLLFAIFSLPTTAAPVQRELAFDWEQDAADLPNLKEWRIYYRTTETGTFQPWLDVNGQQVTIPYDGSGGPTFQSQVYDVSIDVEPGAKATYYFIMRAVDKEGDESADSNVALNPDGSTGVVFKSHLGVPMRVKITVTIVK